jgi:3-oxoacyl-[acyl-carrier protein] reductase
MISETASDRMNKSIVVTGASKGIGRAGADGLAESGWAVIGVARHQPDSSPGQFITADLSDFERTAEVASQLAQRGDVLGIEYAYTMVHGAPET